MWRRGLLTALVVVGSVAGAVLLAAEEPASGSIPEEPAPSCTRCGIGIEPLGSEETPEADEARFCAGIEPHG